MEHTPLEEIDLQHRPDLKGTRKADLFPRPVPNDFEDLELQIST